MPDQGEQLVGLDRLVQILCCSRIHGFQIGVHFTIGGEDHYRHVPSSPSEFLEDGEPVSVGQPQVADHDIEGVFLEDSAGFAGSFFALGGSGGKYSGPGAYQGRASNLARTSEPSGARG